MKKGWWASSNLSGWEREGEIKRDQKKDPGQRVGSKNWKPPRRGKVKVLSVPTVGESNNRGREKGARLE